jgi:hypothetical protein
MKTSGDSSSIQNQQFLNDSNLFEGNKLNPDTKVRKKKLSENFERILKESNSFVVDWQITENP